MKTSEFRQLIREEVRKVLKEETTTTVYVLRHTNEGTPESGEIESIHRTKESALKKMEEVLNDMYDGVTINQNKKEDDFYMFISEAPMYS